MSKCEHIAIVGCGFTGTSALFQLVERELCQRITVFEKSGDFGPGYAYNPADNEHYLLNNTTDSLCLGPDNPRAFIEWLEKQNLPLVDKSPKGNVSRVLYGLFLRDSIVESRKKAAQRDIEVVFIEHEVIQIQESKEAVTLYWNNDELTANHVIMATGRCPDIPTPKAPKNSNGKARYLHSHIMCSEIDDIGKDESILVLGASLSAYDIINRLYAPDTGCSFERDEKGELQFLANTNNRKVILGSRSGRLKKVQSVFPKAVTSPSFDLLLDKNEISGEAATLTNIAEALATDFCSLNSNTALNDIVSPYANCIDNNSLNAKAAALLEHDLERAKSEDSTNTLVDFFSNQQLKIWDAFARGILYPQSEKAYRQKYETATLAYSAPCPVSTAERLLALLRNGAIEIIKDVGNPILSEDGTYFSLPHAYGKLTAQVIIDATGRVDRNVKSQNQPAWVLNLVKDKKLSPYQLNEENMLGADVDMNSYLLTGSKKIYFANMLLWGPGFFTSSAFMMANIVASILDHISANTEA